MSLHTIRSIDYKDGIIQNLQCSLHLRREIHMPRRIQKSYPPVPQFKLCLFGKNRDSALPLQVIGVQISILMIHPPQLTNLSSQIQNPFRQRSLTGIYVRKDTYNKFLHSIFKSSFFFMN